MIMKIKIYIISLVVFSVLLIDVIYNQMYQFKLAMGYIPQSTIFLCVVLVFCIASSLYFLFLEIKKNSKE